MSTEYSDSLLTQIAQLNQRVNQLEQEQARYQAIVQHLPLGVFIYHLEDSNDDTSLRLVAINPMVEVFTGSTPDIGKTLDENYPGLREQGIPQAYAQVIRSGEPFKTEVVYGDEQVITSAFAVQALPIPNNHIAIIFENITKRKQTEADLRLLNLELEQRVAEQTQALEQSQALLQGFLGYSPAIIFARDRAGKYLLVNQKYLSILNTTAEAMIGKMPHEVFAPDVANQLLAHDQIVFEEGKAIEREEYIPHYDEPNAHVYIAAKFPIRNSSGEIYAVGGISTDITERKQALYALEWQAKHNATLAELTRALLNRSTIADISHLILEHACALTGSPFGFAGYIDSHTGYMVISAMTQNIWSQCELMDKSQPIVFKTFTGLWGWVLLNKTSLLTNDATQDERAIGTPMGHVPIQRFLSAPALGNDLLVGQIALANAERDYTAQDLAMLESLASLYAIALHRKQIEDDFLLFKALVESAPDGVSIADSTGKIVYSNAAFTNMLGYGDDTLHMHIQDFHADEERERSKQVLQTVQAAGMWQGIIAHKHKSGANIPVQVSVTTVTDTAGEHFAYAAILRDMTDILQQEQAIRAGADRLRAIIEKIPVGVCITNDHYLFEYVNPAYCAIYHYTKDELIGQPFTMVLPADAREQGAKLHDDFMREGKEIGGEWHTMTKEGTQLTILADAAAIIGEDGFPKKVTFVVDITEIKRNERERQALQDQVIEAQRTAIRELSTPLIPLSDRVVLMPLIGSIDTQRAQQVMETLLEGIASYQADTAILDITGVSVVDTQVANALIQTAQAVKLLGARVILTGIGPTMALTLVHLGADLSSIQTRGSLQSAILDALMLNS
jgi:rsbT co-antagonist protein RsbR